MKTKAEKRSSNGSTSPSTVFLGSGGAFDITIYPIVKLWGFTTGKYEVPNKEEILKNLEYVDSSNITLNEKEGTVTVPQNIEIDLGGIAKGYAGKKAALEKELKDKKCNPLEEELIMNGAR